MIMAIKKLQNNFTIPEQSKRLLELGVPADSADGFYTRENGYRGGNWVSPKLFESDDPKDKVNFKNYYEGGITMYYPLWTVGRLQEIFAICFTGEVFHMWCTDGFYIPENIIEGMELRKNEMDFSKLEE